MKLSFFLLHSRSFSHERTSFPHFCSRREQRFAPDHARIEPALTLLNPEVPLFSPSSSPRISHDPVVNVVFSAPAHGFDSVAACVRAPDVFVDTARITEEVLVHIECSFQRPVSFDFVLYVHNNRRHVYAATHTLVLVERRSVIAFPETPAWAPACRYVRHAWVRDNARFLQIVPGVIDVATVAAQVAFVTRDHVLWRQNIVNSLCFGYSRNAESIREGFTRGEGPTTAALALVSDSVDAVRPLGPRVKGQ